MRTCLACNQTIEADQEYLALNDGSVHKSLVDCERSDYDAPIRIPNCDAVDPNQKFSCKGFEGCHFCGLLLGHDGSHSCGMNDHRWKQTK